MNNTDMACGILGGLAELYLAFIGLLFLLVFGMAVVIGSIEEYKYGKPHREFERMMTEYHEYVSVTPKDKQLKFVEWRKERDARKSKDGKSMNAVQRTHHTMLHGEEPSKTRQ